MIIERLAALREVMKRERLDAFIFPSTDPHHGEYVPDHWKGREFISGFNGSAGTAVVTMQEAALWTDSRYFLAAEEQLRGTSFVLMKQGMEGTPSIAEWLGRKLSAVNGAEVGMDGMVNDVASVEQMKMELRRQGGITLRTNFDPLALIWKDRPELPPAPIVVHPLDYAGESAAHKIGRVREALRERRVYGMLVSALDDIAWLLNLRGADVHCNPVFVSYLLLTQETATLFVNRSKLTIQAEVQLERSGVKVDDYDHVAAALWDYGEYNILMDKGETAYTLYQKAACQEKVGASPIPAMKAVKNEAEQQGFRQAMLRDGVAMVKFLHWLVPAVEAGGHTELSVSARLEELRSRQPLYRGLSFDTIAGYGPHGAIVHYEPTPESDAPLSPSGLLLLDSGAQYTDGTTDITRTIALGPLTAQECTDYTLVLKGHIRLAMVRFPAGSSGTQLDVLARYAMWQQGINYLHGTGHGVGSCLNVHEGPHQIRMNYMPAPLVAGMTVTNEPGIYRAGQHGVRIENTMLITHFMDGEYGEFLQLEPLTLCPIDKKPIVLEMMEADEIAYLNQYHARVYEMLSPYLDEAERAWLQEATSPITID